MLINSSIIHQHSFFYEYYSARSTSLTASRHVSATEGIWKRHWIMDLTMGADYILSFISYDVLFDALTKHHPQWQRMYSVKCQASLKDPQHHICLAYNGHMAKAIETNLPWHTFILLYKVTWYYYRALWIVNSVTGHLVGITAQWLRWICFYLKMSKAVGRVIQQMTQVLLYRKSSTEMSNNNNQQKLNQW